MTKVIEILNRYSKGIDREIERALHNIEPRKLREASQHLIKAGGKKIRPTLVLLSCEAVGGRPEDAFKTAAAIELIHTFSLIHDDIMDKDEIRRGKSSVHVLWGEPMAILAGDTLFSKAFETVLKSHNKDISYDRVINTLNTVVDSCIKICEGQAYDIGFEESFNINEQEYMTMIYKKTAALIAAATKSGSILGGGSKNQIDALSEFGKLIGMAFQIQDDYLDVISDESKIGKPVGSDIVEGKMTLMVVNALEKASSEDKVKLISILTEKNDENILEAINIFRRYGSIDYAREIAKENVITAKKLLNLIDDSEAKKALLLIADFVLERKH
jgi:geranylgeranyl diphosphate synthase, type I